MLSPRSSSATSTDFAGYYGRNRRGFLGYPGRGVAGAAFRNFMNLEAAKAELAADVVESLAIALGQFPLRALLQPADGNDEKAHALKLSCAQPIHTGRVAQMAFAAAGLCVHNLSRL